MLVATLFARLMPRLGDDAFLGAVIAAAREFTNDSKQAYDLAISIVRSFRGTTTLFNVNDVRGHAAVLAVLDEAIAVLGGVKS